ncbi:MULTISPECIES: ABC transporter permease subunit [unclassified Enterococcus]|uniref:ABC transporter permease subunit n=1 Tax=unclassified Enterococcus TaxID=2608891 RepID=UPI001552BB0E|nr:MULTISPECIES: ABC transporter permease subunit [unclassified Enterococcus]MBS7576440.1 ABC transporter permease subunit [Enterococcus sp. MMGLQ5-2]MBS7583672.1 ABC transporter permease subunit [Enterococcus sp. MMGLQ5-1]NPD11533.1 ABC transporter permease subunit [Enterococcus sp. MMGLQ5-1]NPD36277.1 ABC transporter permease subunit [Enterococcus sp. MMGLQ5-2]
MSFKLEVMLNSLKVASQYIGTTLAVSIASLLIGSLLGLLIALVRFYKIKVFSQIFSVLITVLKGVPIVLILLAIYLILAKKMDGFAESLGWSLRFKNLNSIYIAIAALSVMATINSSEIFRGTLNSIGKGQQDAAKSIGMSSLQIIRRILIPQSVPVALPMMSNLLIGLIKASALVSMVGAVDVFAAAKISVQQNYRFLEAYIAVAIIYWGINIIIEQSSNLIEKNLNRRLRRDVA